jgi:hypothetical protein
MSSEIVKAPSAVPATHPGGALSLSQMSPHEAWMFCESLAQTPLLPDAYRRQPASVLWAMEYGRALGLDVVTTITTIHVIKGKPTQSADLMLGRARAAGHRVRIKSERTRCVAAIQRCDDRDDETVIEWTLDDAVTAGLCEIRNDRPYSRSSKGEPQSWEKYPRAMLRARAISECVRTACPEVLHGAIYTPEEIGAQVDADGLPVEAEVQQLRSVKGEADPWQQPAPQQPQTAADGRDYLNEARSAADAETVRRIWQEAKADGAVPQYLAQIAAVGKSLAAGAPPPKPEHADEPVDAEVVSEEEQAARDAEQELRAFAAQQGLPDIERDFEGATGMPLDQAIAPQIRAFLGQLRGTAA